MTIEQAFAAIEQERLAGRCWQITADVELGWIVRNFDLDERPLPGFTWEDGNLVALGSDLATAIETALEK